MEHIIEIPEKEIRGLIGYGGGVIRGAIYNAATQRIELRVEDYDETQRIRQYWRLGNEDKRA